MQTRTVIACRPIDGSTAGEEDEATTTLDRAACGCRDARRRARDPGCTATARHDPSRPSTGRRTSGSRADPRIHQQGLGADALAVHLEMRIPAEVEVPDADDL